jgi:L-asparaginase II
VTRGGLVESRHEIAACAADAGGRIVLAYGDVERPVYVRSAAKPFIAAALVRTGTADRFGFGARELATIAASHNGEPAHVKVVEGILATIGLSAADLQCGAHAPAFEPAAQELAARGEPYTALHNNCSGKHAGILAMCVHLGLDHRGYLAAGHAVQQTILSFCARMVDEDVARLTLGIDGCGIPVFATPLYRAARAFARLATLEGLDEQDRVALVRVREAMTAEPWYVAGTGRLDTAIMQATQGRIVCKAGAEGVHGDALLGLGLGLALKVLDGARRAAAPAVVSVLTEVGALGAAERAALARFAAADVRNVAGRVVGCIEMMPDTIEAGATS